MVETNVGKGRVLLFGNDLLFRTQPHGNYKFFFNGLYLSVAAGDEGGDGAVRANFELRTLNFELGSEVPGFRGFESSKFEVRSSKFTKGPAVSRPPGPSC